jgi:hypothetical protein
VAEVAFASTVDRRPYVKFVVAMEYAITEQGRPIAKFVEAVGYASMAKPSTTAQNANGSRGEKSF